MKHLPLIISSTLVVTAVVAMLAKWWPSEPEPTVITPPETESRPETREPSSDPELAVKKTAPKANPDQPQDSEVPAKPEHNYYSFGDQSFEHGGIGKYYQGREISTVMGHLGIRWLERDAREAEEAPTKAIELLDLGKNETLADIGAGSGYYATRIAMTYPESKVIGVDIQPEMIAFLEGKARQLGLDNLTARKSTIQDVRLPAESIDAALMVDAYHEFSHPYEMMTSLVRALKPGGRVYLLEYREEDESVRMLLRHKMSQAQAKKEMALVGLKWEKTLDDLPWQHFMVFRKP